MGNLFYTPPPQTQPVIIQSGTPGSGQTTVIYPQQAPPQGYYYGPSGQLLEIALVADIATDIMIMDALIVNNGFYGGKPKKTKAKITKNAKIKKDKKIKK